MARVPDRGDIVLIDLEPTRGAEQRGTRPVFVVSPRQFNRRGLIIALPVTKGLGLSRSEGFMATLMGSGGRTQGSVACDQPRTLDYRARNARLVESVPEFVTRDVLARLAPLVT